MPHERRPQAATPDDGVVAEPVAHGVQRLVDLVARRTDATEEVALDYLISLDKSMGAHADQAEAATVGLASEQRLDGSERNLSTTLRHWRLRFTEQSLLLWLSRVG